MRLIVKANPRGAQGRVKILMYTEFGRTSELTEKRTNTADNFVFDTKTINNPILRSHVLINPGTWLQKQSIVTIIIYTIVVAVCWRGDEGKGNRTS